MQIKFRLLLALCLISTLAFTQTDSLPTLDIGSPAPPLQVGEWLKGKPVTGFQKGKIYVVEFWATWCGPCIGAMPHLSALARKYKRKVTVIGMNIYERKKPVAAVATFVDSMASVMKYRIATQDSDFMEKSWMEATGEHTIPTSFVIDRESKIAWIGNTTYLPDALSRIVDGNWDLESAKAERNLNKRLEKLDYETFRETIKYNDNRYMTEFIGEPDSTLQLIDKSVAKEPGLKYSYNVSFSTFHALLRKDPLLALEYGKGLIASKNYAAYEAITIEITFFPYQTNTLPPKIFELGADAYQALIDHFPYTMKTAANYLKMAEWYMRANEKTKARQSLKKAGKLTKKSKGKIWSGFM